MNYKKLLATAVFTLGAWISAGAMAQSSTVTYTGTGNTYTYYDFSTTTTTNYDITTSVYTGSNDAALTTDNPWWSKVGVADLFASEVNVRSGTPNSGVGPIFQYDPTGLGGIAWNGSFSFFVPSSLTDRLTFAVATPTGGIAPEMNASLIPQVGLLLGCLFFLMGRKREVVEPLLAA